MNTDKTEDTRAMQRLEQKELWHKNFTFQKVTPSGLKKMEQLRSASKAMADALIDLVPASREQSLALTHLEEMLFHANSGVARYNIEPETTNDEQEQK